MKKWGIILILFMLASCGGSGDSPLTHNTDYVESGTIMMLGDSITEMLSWEEFDGVPILNAGKGGSRIDDVMFIADDLLYEEELDFVIVMVGVNDCVKGLEVDVDEWGHKYEVLLDSIHNSGAIPIVMSIMPVEKDMPLGDAYFDVSRIWELNKRLWEIVTDRDEIRINLNYDFAIPSEYLYMYPGWTVDGVHPTEPTMAILYDIVLETLRGET